MKTQRQIVILCKLAMIVGCLSFALPAFGQPWPKGVSCLIKSYPQDLCDFKDNQLIWCDGTKMQYQIVQARRPLTEAPDHRQFEQQLNNADLNLQMSESYPNGMDPGRARFEPFFAKLYCQDQRACRANSVRIAWPLPGSGDGLRLSNKFEIPARIQRIGKKLAAWRPWLTPAGGGFSWREIAQTARRSTHSYGIAIDLNPSKSSYWLWHQAFANFKNHLTQPFANFISQKLPEAIPRAFEAEGFIWGGHWHHFDTMHFEYRPEILCLGSVIE